MSDSKSGFFLYVRKKGVMSDWQEISDNTGSFKRMMVPLSLVFIDESDGDGCLEMETWVWLGGKKGESAVWMVNKIVWMFLKTFCRPREKDSLSVC